MAYHRLCLDVTAALQTPLHNHEEGMTGSGKVLIFSPQKRDSWAPIVNSLSFTVIQTLLGTHCQL
jgi:hypothetical protein